MTKIVKSRAPVRISFGGGGTDVSPYTEEYGGAVVNAAINKYAFCTLKLRTDQKIIITSDDFEQTLTLENKDALIYDGNLDVIKAVIKKMHKYKCGLEIRTRCEVAPRSGLGSSAAVFASLIGAFNHLEKEYRLDDYALAELAYDLERRELKNLGGRQDQYAAIFGNINFLEFKGNDFVRVHPLKLKNDDLYELESNLLLLNIGSRQESGAIIEEQTKNAKSDKKTLEAMHKTKILAQEIKYSLLRGNLTEFGQLLDQGWQLKKMFSAKISNEKIDHLYQEMKKLGAWGGKITGAGGGGHLIVYCRPFAKPKIVKRAEELGAVYVPFNFDMLGLTTWEINE
ncbi:MAG: hypothetical protein A2319_01390 [Candidatus Kerfeldbacteria bacterium RIFOXYB2_FULL_38_14]|uniref:GHMP kinase n=1 Tax=Candidatus Kerfeldbacteria bacterium RIFOXYB2_FULL_38_14 TaxID=1798547 RepID=A0A1G2BBL5_9BACT|nr:MAG: hypothetical protein A2319_01390 [Candidatus Kerfeldbacteria bacterium RIFOXYB2_FULL_38_14]